MKCRACREPLNYVFVDLGYAPPSNSYRKETQLNEPETYFPLKLFVCEHCWLVQIDEVAKSADIFDQEYAYFSSFSESWLEHSRNYVEHISEKLSLNSESRVIEIASNDGYLLQYFVAKNIDCLGIEPTQSTALAAEQKGVPTRQAFFSQSLASELVREDMQADLVLGNNVLAHVPDINDFVAGMKTVLKATGTITMEFPHLLNLIEQMQFDTIYHEHYSYLSLVSVQRVFEQHELIIYRVEKIPTHGGSLRIYARHQEHSMLLVESSVQSLLAEESQFGLQALVAYEGFQNKVDQIKNEFLSFLLDQKRQGKKIAAYGAAAKGCTLLNYCGIKTDLIDYVVDANPHKTGKRLPGSHIPIENPEFLVENKPDVVVVLPWNIKDEIVRQLQALITWRCDYVTAIPFLSIKPLAVANV